ncbi:hypothetical protein Ancab_028421 [Ancistrocladus abbreviatus]
MNLFPLLASNPFPPPETLTPPFGFKIRFLVDVPPDSLLPSPSEACPLQSLSSLTFALEFILEPRKATTLRMKALWNYLSIRQEFHCKFLIDDFSAIFHSLVIFFF